MKDYQSQLQPYVSRRWNLHSSGQLATVLQKRDLFAKLAAHLNTLATEVERATPAANEPSDGDTRP